MPPPPWRRLMADDGFGRLRSNSAPRPLSGIHATYMDGLDAGVPNGSSVGSAELDGRNRQLICSRFLFARLDRNLYKAEADSTALITSMASCSISLLMILTLFLEQNNLELRSRYFLSPQMGQNPLVVVSCPLRPSK